MVEFIRNVKIEIKVEVDTNKRTVKAEGDFDNLEAAVEWLSDEALIIVGDEHPEGEPFGGADPASSLGEVMFVQTSDKGLEIGMQLNDNGRKLIDWVNRGE